MFRGTTNQITKRVSCRSLSLRRTVIANPPQSLAFAVADILRLERMQTVGPLKALVLVVASVIGIILINEAWKQ